MPARISPRRLAALAALALVAVLVAAATIFQEVRLLGAKTRTPHVAATATPRPTPTPTFAPLPPMLPAGQGWVKTGPAYAQTVALAPSQPTTLYTCGRPATADGHLSPSTYLGVSRDGGRTWQTSTLPADCAALVVSPTNPQDVAFEGGTCQGACAGVPGSDKYWVYLSTDGGKRWTQAKLPPNASNAPEAEGYLVAWAGTILFVSPRYPAGESPPHDAHTLAASTNGGPFVWVDQNGMLDRAPAGATLYRLVSVGNTLFVTFGGFCAELVSQPCARVATTSDGGATWSHMRPMYQGEDLQILGGAAGRALLGLPGDSSSPSRAAAALDGWRGDLDGAAGVSPQLPCARVLDGGDTGRHRLRHVRAGSF
jgi:hypothetical protein